MFKPTVTIRGIIEARDALDAVIDKSIKERLSYIAPNGHSRNIELSGPTQEITPTVTVKVPVGTGKYLRDETITGFGFSRNKDCEINVTFVETCDENTVNTAALSLKEKIDIITLLNTIIKDLDAGQLVTMHTMIRTKEETTNKK